MPETITGNTGPETLKATQPGRLNFNSEDSKCEFRKY